MAVQIDLEGKTALVTGASSGIGAATALRLAEAGARVIVHYGADRAGADRTRDRIQTAGGVAATLQLDLSSGRSAGVELYTRVAGASQELGGDGLDIAILNAGTSKGIQGRDYTDEALSAVLGVNTLSFLGFLESAADGAQLRTGSITVVSSTAATLPLPGSLSYGLSKAGANYLVRAGAALVQARGIRVNAVSPGATATPIRKDPVQDAQIRAEGRLAEPEDIADVALLLASDLSRWVTGQIVEAFGKYKV